MKSVYFLTSALLYFNIDASSPEIFRLPILDRLRDLSLCFSALVNAIFDPFLAGFTDVLESH